MKYAISSSHFEGCIVYEYSDENGILESISFASARLRLAQRRAVLAALPLDVAAFLEMPLKGDSVRLPMAAGGQRFSPRTSFTDLYGSVETFKTALIGYATRSGELNSTLAILLEACGDYIDYAQYYHFFAKAYALRKDWLGYATEILFKDYQNNKIRGNGNGITRANTAANERLGLVKARYTNLED